MTAARTSTATVCYMPLHVTFSRSHNRVASRNKDEQKEVPGGGEVPELLSTGQLMPPRHDIRLVRAVRGNPRLASLPVTSADGEREVTEGLEVGLGSQPAGARHGPADGWPEGLKRPPEPLDSRTLRATSSSWTTSTAVGRVGRRGRRPA